MSSDDVGIAESSASELTAATCAHHRKYVGVQGFSYAELLRSLFAAGVKKIWHIGTLPDEQREAIERKVGGEICFIPNVPSMAKTLIELRPTFYIDSHPIGGGRAQIEALSVGLPILISIPEGTPPLSKGDMAFGNGVTIRELTDVPGAIARISGQHAQLCADSRAVYEEKYHPDVFRRNVRRLIE